MPFDLGDRVQLSWTASSAGGTVAASVHLPDGSTATPTLTTSAAIHTITYTPTVVGRHVAVWSVTGAVVDSHVEVFDVVGVSDAGLVSLADAKAHLNITTSTYDDELRTFVGVASDLVEEYTGRSYRRRTHTDVFDGGYPAVTLTRCPVESVTSVVVDGVTLSASNWSINKVSGILRYKHGVFNGDYDDVVVTYVAGSGVVPGLIHQATLEVTRHLWETQRGSMGGRNPLNGDDYGTAGRSFSMPRRVTELLASIRVPGIG